MQDNWHDLSRLLTRRTVTSSAPCRIDCGGSTDHRLSALLCKQDGPATVNIALDLRTTVYLKPYLPDRVLLEVNGLGKQEISIKDISFVKPFGLLLAIIVFFRVHGVHILVHSEAPVRSGLGGSGAVSVAVIGALSAILSTAGRKSYKPKQIVLLAHNIEDALYGNTGLQDQAAAVYGNVNYWEWQFNSNLNFVRHRLPCDLTSLAEHIVIAYTGAPHPLSDHGSEIIKTIKNGHFEHISILTEISNLAKKFAYAIQTSDYHLAGSSLREEHELRKKLFSGVADDKTMPYLLAAKELGCGSKVAGYGGGGCVWSIGPKDLIHELKARWQSIVTEQTSGYLLPVKVSQTGLDVELT